jgi:succinate-semialdehyde dehydrogenase/glutarate-semialdehyde dehydrogenase
VQGAVDKGVTLVAGGSRVDPAGADVQATVLTDVTPDVRPYSEELFGPLRGLPGRGRRRRSRW